MAGSEIPRLPGKVRRRLVLLAALIAVIGSPILADAGFNGDKRVRLEGPYRRGPYTGGGCPAEVVAATVVD